MDLHWNAKDIEPELKRLSNIASSLEPGLAYRLEELRRWIKDKKPGLLTSKKFVMDFLSELLIDAQTWLDIKALTFEEREEVFNIMTPPEKYWYDFLFPKWFNESDPKLPVWKQKIMAGEFTKTDDPLINLVVYQIERDGGNVLRRYILDLSMATDLVVSGSLFSPVCVQMTIVSNQLSVYKKQHWEATLRYWTIKRSLFINFNPANQIEIVPRLANEIIWHSDYLPTCCYTEISIAA